MRYFLVFSLIVAMSCGFVGEANAAKKNKPKKDPKAEFAKLDKNNDGVLSFQEFSNKGKKNKSKKKKK